MGIYLYLDEIETINHIKLMQSHLMAYKNYFINWKFSKYIVKNTQ